MTSFQPLAFDLGKCREELGDLRAFLSSRKALKEREHLLPFFKAHPHLSAFLASYSPDSIRFDRLAFEYELFGDFACDVAVGDSAKGAYCFVEFEDAGPSSLFVKRGKKATRDWSPRFEHGYSQIIDWFCLLDDLAKTDAFARRFDGRSIRYTGILVIGRDHYLKVGERERLN